MLSLFCSKWRDKEMKQWRRWEGEFNLFRYATLWISRCFSVSPNEGKLQPLQCPGPPGWGHGLNMFSLFQPSISGFPFLLMRCKVGDMESTWVLAGCTTRNQLLRVPGTPSWNMASAIQRTFFFVFSFTSFISLTPASYSTVQFLPQAVLSIVERH